MRQVATCSDGVGLVIAIGTGRPSAPGAYLREDGAAIESNGELWFPTFAAARNCALERLRERLAKTDPDLAKSGGLHIDWRTE